MASDDQDETADGPVAQRTPGRRRVADRVLAAVHAACDQGELDVAAELLTVLEALVTRGPPAADPQRRRNLEALAAAHERLWYLRHPGTGER